MNVLADLQSGDPGLILIVTAHPDDEVIGAGAQLPKWRNVAFVHVTDGAPRNSQDALAAGFSRSSDYAKARRTELRAALRIVEEARLKVARRSPNYTPIENVELAFVDQETAFHLILLVQWLREILAKTRPNLIITHPYEGGHPDHDSTAFAVHAACQLLRRDQIFAPQIIEMASYHSRNGQFVSGKFLPTKGDVLQLPLSESERVFKRQLFDCFVTQQGVLAQFEMACERFRGAPTYDFSQPPHEGPLYYERFDWQMTGVRWRNLARKASATLGVQTQAVLPQWQSSSGVSMHFDREAAPLRSNWMGRVVSGPDSNS